MHSSNSGTSPPPSRSVLLNVPTVHGVEGEIPMNQLLPSQERRKLKLSTNVTEPLVVALDASRFGDSSYENYLEIQSKHLIVLPKKGSLSLQDCILVTPLNWEMSGLPNFWISTKSDETKPLGRGGALRLIQETWYAQSVHHLAWHAASRFVDRRHRYPLSRVQKRSRTEFWMNRGWAGTEKLVPVPLSSSKTLYQRLKSRVISKWSAFMGATSP